MECGRWRSARARGLTLGSRLPQQRLRIWQPLSATRLVPQRRRSGAWPRWGSGRRGCPDSARSRRLTSVRSGSGGPLAPLPRTWITAPSTARLAAQQHSRHRLRPARRRRQGLDVQTQGPQQVRTERRCRPTHAKLRRRRPQRARRHGAADSKILASHPTSISCLHQAPQANHVTEGGTHRNPTVPAPEAVDVKLLTAASVAQSSRSK
jgi:hypothetical protein